MNQELDTSRWLVTGFGPFRDVVENPSAQLAEQSGCPFRVLEVAYQAVDDFIDTLDATTFDTLLMLGVAVGRDRLCPELFARNSIGKGADFRGESRFGSIEPGGPLLVSSTLWNAERIANWTVSLPLRASWNAGAYLCNYIFFRALRRFPDKRVGFLHVPAVEQVSLDRQVEVLRSIIHDGAVHPS